MKHLNKIYRSNYQGENIITDLVHKNASWIITKEFIDNSVINNQRVNQACVIGNGISRKDFDLKVVIDHTNHREKLQTYGCNALYRDHSPDFLVAAGKDSGMPEEIAASGYCADHIVYASAKHIQDFPDNFYLIPQDPDWNAGSMATYLACFDGHKKVFLLGFDGGDTAGANYNIYAGTPHYQNAREAHIATMFFDVTMKKIFDVYHDVDFVRVMPSEYASMPESWKYCVNVRQINFQQFVIEADL